MDKIINTEPIEKFPIVFQDIVSNLYNSKCDSSVDIESSVIEQAKEELKDIISSCNFNINKIRETFQNNSWNQDKINCLISLLEEKRSEILFSALNHYNSSYGETVKNFDWITKLVLGTNELKSHKYSLLQLVLTTSNCRGEQMKTTYELNKEILLKLIHVLEEISEK